MKGFVINITTVSVNKRSDEISEGKQIAVSCAHCHFDAEQRNK